MLGKIIPLSKITDRRGNLTVAEQLKDVPFEVKRAYWVYDVPGGESRGGHAHKQLYQLIVALSGSFTVNLDDGKERQSYLLNHPWEGLLITPGIRRTPTTSLREQSASVRPRNCMSQRTTSTITRNFSSTKDVRDKAL